ncbi:hypothetical protein HKX48_009160 [Thoreauomyces humboldtii]|nr:hypothetical protein HKX48_009160 [Thoreauomyces humboldtii]
MSFALPLTSGLLSGATAYQLLQNRISRDTEHVKAAILDMQRDLEVNLPHELQDESLFVPQTAQALLAQQRQAAARCAGGYYGEDVVSVLGYNVRMPAWRKKTAEVKGNWNRTVAGIAKSVTGNF